MKRICFQDEAGDRLDVCYQKVGPDRWSSFVRHNKGQGATSFHNSEKEVMKAWLDLEAQAIVKGWRLLVQVVQDRSPGYMHVTADGKRLFRDRRTGEMFEDESASRPPQVPGRLAPGEYVFDDFNELPPPRNA